MSAAQTGSERLAQISVELSRHEAAVSAPRQALPSFSRVGVGGKLALPDGREYGAYLSNDFSPGERLQVTFFGEALQDPTRITNLGHIIMLFDGMGRGSYGDVSSYGQPSGNGSPERRHTFPVVSTLAVPLGVWLAEGSRRAVDLLEASNAAHTDLANDADRLREYVTKRERGESGPTLETAYRMLKRVFAARERVDASSASVVCEPTLEDVAVLDAFVHDPQAETLFIAQTTNSRHNDLLHEYVAGPLLGQV